LGSRQPGILYLSWRPPLFKGRRITGGKGRTTDAGTRVPFIAFRPDLEHHPIAREWLQTALNNGRSIRLFPTVEAGFLRVVTHSAIFNPPFGMAEASAFLHTLFEVPSVGIASWTAACRKRWLTLCSMFDLSGNDCNDAMLAAVALEKGLRIVSFDKGFQRFPDLKSEVLEG
jgi:toxin-antitoxin system PIN domain toxin